MLMDADSAASATGIDAEIVGTHSEEGHIKK